MDYGTLQPEQLICICAGTGEPTAWEEFIRRFNPLITRVVIRTARRWGETSPSVFDDLVQETYLKLCSEDCRLLRTFQSRQPEAIYGYLKVVCANLVHDHFKAAHAAKRGAGEIVEDMGVAEITAVSSGQSSSSDSASIERDILLREIDQNLTKLVPVKDLPRSRLIFWLYYRSGLSANAIASIPTIGLTTKGVESTLLRLTRLVRAALAAPETQDKERQQDSSQDQKGYRQAESF
jgi:RNA polymerase sigma-70 factor (ECF subfamily)